MNVKCPLLGFLCHSFLGILGFTAPEPQTLGNPGVIITEAKARRNGNIGASWAEDTGVTEHRKRGAKQW